MLTISDSAEGCMLSVKARPRSRREGITGIWNDSLCVAVREPATDGRANEAVLSVLSDVTGLRVRSLHISAGAASQRKVIFFSGLRSSELRARLVTALRKLSQP